MPISNLKSQWEFDDLFTQPAPRRVLSVSELTSSVKRLLAQQIGRVWVTGEITNLRSQSSGHLYFCLKDAGAQLNCVLFRSEARTFNRALLRDGLGVNLHGEMSVYEARGQYQLIVAAVELQGEGALQAAFEKLKQKLQAEGLFAPERKRPLPRFPHRIGIVTSVSGAAIRDVVHAVRRRYASLELILASCRVQGQGAAEEVACAIRLLNEWDQAQAARSGGRIDLILVTRGGGSLEDLWAFNEEAVARAIFESKVPVLSAVGHEIDFTISDFVADFRAATPTAAAEIITEGYFASRPTVSRAALRLRQLTRAAHTTKTDELLFCLQRLQRQHPRRWLQEQWQHLDDLQNAVARAARYSFRDQSGAWQSLAQRLLRLKPSQILARRREILERTRQRLAERTTLNLRQRREMLVQAESRLRLLSPLNILERGYSITRDAASGRVIRSAQEVQAGQTILSRVQQGEIRSVVEPE